jgi:hypothetical protein
MRYFLMVVLLAQPLAAQTFKVIHVKTLRRDERGEVEFTEKGVAYKAAKEKNSRFWKYADIQYFDRLSEKEFTILSYEDQRLLLGRDKEYRFRITDGSLTDKDFREIQGWFGKPSTDRVIPKITGLEYEIPAKHLHTFGGCEGSLEFTKDAIYYVTKDKKDARVWQLGLDVQSVWSDDPYRLEIYAYDNNRREFSRTRGYQFDLKEPLDPTFYRHLKLKLYDLEKVHLALGDQPSPGQ